MDGAAAAETLRDQAALLRGRSRLYERLLAGLAGAAERGFDGGVIPRVLTLDGPSGPDEARWLMLAALHHAALEDPSLPHAAWFTAPDASRHREPDQGAPGALALAHLVEHEADVSRFVASHRWQTNEVARCVALLPGVLEAGGFGLPLRLLELGAAAGLNLRLDRYRYHYRGGPSWGSTVGPELETRAEGAPPRALTPPSLEVAERRGVDLDPIDPTTEAGRRLLHAFLSPDDARQHERLHQALEVADSTPVTLERGDLLGWADTHVAAADGRTTVVFHSQVRSLLDPADVTALGDIIERALRSAQPTAPVVYAALEEPRGLPSDAATWPELTVATCDGTGPPRWHTLLSADWHGRWVRWFLRGAER